MTVDVEEAHIDQNKNLSPKSAAKFDEKKLFVTWERFKPEDGDDLATGLCKTVAFLLRHVAGTGYVWVPFNTILKKARDLWGEGIEQNITEEYAYIVVQKHDGDEARPRFQFKTEGGVHYLRALPQSERVTRPARDVNVEKPLKVFRGQDMIGYVDPASMNRAGRIWN